MNKSSKHRLDIISDLERGFCLGANIFDSHAFSELDESKTCGEVDVEYALLQ